MEESVHIDAAWLRRRYESDMAQVVDIAQELGCSPDLVRKRLAKYGIPKRPRYRPSIDPAWLRRKYEAGVLSGDIAKELDCSRDLVWRALIKYGIPRRPPGHQMATTKPLVMEGYRKWRSGTVGNRTPDQPLDTDDLPLIDRSVVPATHTAPD